MQSLISLCAGALVLSGCGATSASRQVHFASNSRAEAAPAVVEQARAVVEPVAPPVGSTRLAKEEPATEQEAEEHAANAKRDDIGRADPNPYRQVQVREVAEFGMIGVVYANRGNESNVAHAPLGRAASIGGEASSASGSMWHDSIGDSGGLALSGIGEGAGGLGAGIGYDTLGTLGDGTDKGAPEVLARAQMDLGREEGIVKSPRTVAEAPRANPDSEASLVAKFVMDRSGSIALAAVGATPSAIVAAQSESREAGRDIQALVSADVSRSDIVARTVRRVAYGYSRWQREEF